MTHRPEIVRELRSLFRDGATPSRLIRHLADRHPGGATHAVVQTYFREAFGVPIVRGLSTPDEVDPPDLRYAFLNAQLLHDIIERRAEWDDDPTAPGWLDGLTATADADRLPAGPVPELRAAWDHLSPAEQAFVRRTVAAANGLYETVRALSRLAERLQQQVADLQPAAAAAR